VVVGQQSPIKSSEVELCQRKSITIAEARASDNKIGHAHKYAMISAPEASSDRQEYQVESEPTKSVNIVITITAKLHMPVEQVDPPDAIEILDAVLRTMLEAEQDLMGQNEQEAEIEYDDTTDWSDEPETEYLEFDEFSEDDEYSDSDTPSLSDVTLSLANFNESTDTTVKMLLADLQDTIEAMSEGAACSCEKCRHEAIMRRLVPEHRIPPAGFQGN
jgi:hypothetical protein